jgi:hypothetical protein
VGVRGRADRCREGNQEANGNKVRKKVDGAREERKGVAVSMLSLLIGMVRYRRSGGAWPIHHPIRSQTVSRRCAHPGG